MAAGADRVLDERACFTTAWRPRSPIAASCWPPPRAITTRPSPWSAPAKATAEMAPRIAGGETVALVFGRERNGLENHEVALADRILTLPVNPAFASLNLAQAVVIVGYEWFKLHGGGACRSRCRKNRRRRPSSSSTCFSRTWSANSRRSSSSGRRKSAAPCASTCAISSSACSRRNRTCAPCTA